MSLTLKPSDIPEFQKTPLPKPESKSELESNLSKNAKDQAKFAKDDHDRTKRDLEMANAINTDHKPTAPTLDREGAETKKDDLVVEKKPGNTAFIG